MIPSLRWGLLLRPSNSFRRPSRGEGLHDLPCSRAVVFSLKTTVEPPCHDVKGALEDSFSSTICDLALYGPESLSDGPRGFPGTVYPTVRSTEFYQLDTHM